MHRLQELVRLHRLGLTERRAAKELRIGRNTAKEYRRALSEAGVLDGSVDELPTLEVLKALVLRALPPRPAPQQVSKLEEWQPAVEALLEQRLGPQAIHDRLRLEHPDYQGSIGGLKRLVRRIRRSRGVRPEDVTIPVDTEPGDVAQVDFGYAGKLWDTTTGTLRKAWVFVMVLGYSRHQYCEVVFDQRTTTWLELHQRAFACFGGVPRVIVPDNLKAAVIRAAFGVSGLPELNRSYRELARYYGFRVDPAPPRAPKKKGKVESGVKYVKNNFLRGRRDQDVAEVNRELARWTLEIAGTRVHGTTGRRPMEVFLSEEKAHLLPLPVKRYETVVWKQASVHADCHVHFDKRLYSAPWRLINQEVWVRATSTSVAIYADDVRVATHSRRGKKQRSTHDEHLPEGRAELRHRSRAYWEERADRMSPEVGVFVREVFDSDDVLLQLRAVQAIVTYLEKFPVERATAAARRASFYGSNSYQAVKNILTRALDLEPLPTSRAQPMWADAPRFARDLSKLFDSEGGNEHH
ncbi:MAG: IS21 family transposase [Myxococcales bacterium]